MARRARSPTPEEIDRINETLDNRSGFKIQDRDSYDLAFNDYMSFTPSIIKGDSALGKFQNDAFKDYTATHPEVSSERLFTKAGGKDLRRDRSQTAKKVVTTTKEFRKLGASEVDLKGFDTARQRVTDEIISRRTFTIPARVKGRTVFARRDFVKIRGKQTLRHRDKKGRFVSPRAK